MTTFALGRGKAIHTQSAHHDTLTWCGRRIEANAKAVEVEATCIACAKSAAADAAWQIECDQARAKDAAKLIRAGKFASVDMLVATAGIMGSSSASHLSLERAAQLGDDAIILTDRSRIVVVDRKWLAGHGYTDEANASPAAAA